MYKGHALTLTRFWANKKTCLWINSPSQRKLPHMEFVGGHPNEYCIFVEKLSAEERAQITTEDGSPIDIETELVHLK